MSAPPPPRPPELRRSRSAIVDLADDDPAMAADLMEVCYEVARQEDQYGLLSPTVASTRLGIAVCEDEVEELRNAWRDERKGPGPWSSVPIEALQVAAIALRVYRATRGKP